MIAYSVQVNILGEFHFHFKIQNVSKVQSWVSSYTLFGCPWKNQISRFFASIYILIYIITRWDKISYHWAERELTTLCRGLDIELDRLTSPSWNLSSWLVRMKVATSGNKRLEIEKCDGGQPSLQILHQLKQTVDSQSQWAPELSLIKHLFS